MSAFPTTDDTPEIADDSRGLVFRRSEKDEAAHQQSLRSGCVVVSIIAGFVTCVIAWSQCAGSLGLAPAVAGTISCAAGLPVFLAMLTFCRAIVRRIPQEYVELQETAFIVCRHGRTHRVSYDDVAAVRPHYEPHAKPAADVRLENRCRLIIPHELVPFEQFTEALATMIAPPDTQAPEEAEPESSPPSPSSPVVKVHERRTWHRALCIGIAALGGLIATPTVLLFLPRDAWVGGLSAVSVMVALLVTAGQAPGSAGFSVRRPSNTSTSPRSAAITAQQTAPRGSKAA